MISCITGNAIALGYASLNQRLSAQSTLSKGGLRVYPVPSDGLGWTVESAERISAFNRKSNERTCVEQSRFSLVD